MTPAGRPPARLGPIRRAAAWCALWVVGVTILVGVALDAKAGRW